MLSLCELRRVAAILDARFSGHRLERWVQPDGERLVFSVYGREPGQEAGRKRHLLLCATPRLARLSELAAVPPAPQQSPAFVSYLRAHLGSARLRGAGIVADDRQLALHFETREGRFDLLLSLLANRSNVYLLGEGGELLAALRPLPKTRPELALGDPWQNPSGGPPRDGEDRWADVADADYLRAVETDCGAVAAERGSEQLARQLLQVLRKEGKSARRRLERVEAELAEADQARELQSRGELLKSALGRIRPGDSQVRVEDYETGREVEIPLDPKLSAKENLQATFKRYQKLLRRLAKAGGQVDPARARVDEIEQLERRCTELAEGGDEASEELQALAARPEVERLFRKYLPDARPVAPEAQREPVSKLPPRLRELPRRLLPRRYRSRDDLEIWVGRSDEGNDLLTTRLARGNDLFFHLDGAPGSHVVLRTEGRTDPPSESVIDACELAVHFSKYKNAGRADVHLVPIKQVKKPKGAKRGLVWVTGGKTIHLRREPGRLERLLGSRIDD
jgi:predicted ribosome quality control (RQC) complex YloA/Tae2 family protein